MMKAVSQVWCGVETKINSARNGEPMPSSAVRRAAFWHVNTLLTHDAFLVHTK